MTTWRIGELAAVTGLTVRTLHHYDEIGLLVPSERTESGHRVYREADAERLYRICALKSIGMSLAQIAEVLDAESLADALTRHLDHLEEEARRVIELRNRVRRIASYAAGELDVHQLVGLVAAMTQMESHLTRSQLDALARRHREAGPGHAVEAERRWRQLAEELRPYLQAGAPPASPDVRRIAREADQLIDGFTGGNAEIREALNRLRSFLPEEGLAGWDARLLEYLYEALAASADP